LPLQPPARALAAIAMGRVVDIPQINVEIMVQVRPTKIAGFRPNISDALPQRIAVVHCEREKTAEVMPAHFATSFFFTPKLSIISGCENVSKLQRWGIVTHEVWKDRSHGDRFCKSTYCFVPISLCSEYIKSSQEAKCKVWDCGVSRTSIGVTRKKKIGYSARPELEQTGFHNFKNNLKIVDFLHASSRDIFKTSDLKSARLPLTAFFAVLTQHSQSFATRRKEFKASNSKV
jgi:hypothetical protein